MKNKINNLIQQRNKAFAMIILIWILTSCTNQGIDIEEKQILKKI